MPVLLVELPSPFEIVTELATVDRPKEADCGDAGLFGGGDLRAGGVMTGWRRDSMLMLIGAGCEGWSVVDARGGDGGCNSMGGRRGWGCESECGPSSVSVSKSVGIFSCVTDGDGRG